ncbi:gamma-mobile-trio recombinase GmtY [Pseudomonas sp. UBA2684]|uniref:gamma-mobile-trio recombinase GmtY n=1 Tax=Pseudomonas sp. UBA2684 TaxID=1947311 RepID=UPI0025F17DAC|nr:gamma-mobile-trio recombinase GmtY [Pseudomonas sp. UBA2684]|tara:strand:- start:3904 stop:5292 length:1389 start_codon:yes stop_codon:yes gene_type:complete
MKTFFESSHREYRTIIGDATGMQDVLPVVVTEHGVLDQFVRYMYLNRRKSRSWQDAATFAIQLLLEFMEANQGFFEKPRELFTSFSNALYTGTSGGGRDPSGLYWQPRQPDDASKLIGHITRFTDWLSAINEDTDLQLNPWRNATRHEQRLNWAAYSHRRDNAFLSHLFRRAPQTDQSRVVRSQGLPIDDLTPAKTFPVEKLNLLFTEGFRRIARDRRGPIDLRNVLITLLMHYGSLRLSEALSLWSDDVTLENGEVIVRVYHPEYGLAPDGKTNRASYLQKRFGMLPRNRLVKAIDPLFLGWKDALLTDPIRKCFEVFFFPHFAGQTFARLWRDYHLIQRVKPAMCDQHPYAFTSRNGRPYSHRMFRKAHQLAVERIGLEYGKLQGTTPHGHRHAYGQRMSAAGAPAISIKTAMHHKSIESSQTYTVPTSTDFRSRMIEMESRLSEQHANVEVLQLGREEK